MLVKYTFETKARFFSMRSWETRLCLGESLHRRFPARTTDWEWRWFGAAQRAFRRRYDDIFFIHSVAYPGFWFGGATLTPIFNVKKNVSLSLAPQAKFLTLISATGRNLEPQKRLPANNLTSSAIGKICDSQ